MAKMVDMKRDNISVRSVKCYITDQNLIRVRQGTFQMNNFSFHVICKVKKSASQLRVLGFDPTI